MPRWSQPYQLRLIKELHFTPLMGVVMALVLVLLLTLPFWQSQLTSPPVSAVANAPASAVTLTVGPDQALTLDGKIIARSDLVKALQQLAQQHHDLGVVIQLPHDLPVHVLVGLMADLKAAGMAKISFTNAS